MDLKIKKMNINNFKGIAALTVDFNKDKTEITGPNGSGKTTIQDAFMWLLFGKDHTGATQFNVRPLGADGTPKHYIEISVEATLEVDGKDVMLKRLSREKWVRRRNQKTEEYDGNETLYEWNEVPVKKKDFTDKLTALIDEERFQLLTNINAFSRMNWKDQRRQLMDMVGGIEPEEIVNGDEALTPLLQEIQDAEGLDNYAKKVAKARKQYNERIKEIPARIDEATKMLVEGSLEEAVAEVKAREEAVKEAENALKAVSCGEKTDHLEAAIDKAKVKLEKRKSEIAADLSGRQQHILREKMSLEKMRDKIEGKLLERERATKECARKIAHLTEDVAVLRERKDDLLEQYESYANAQHSVEEYCPTCKQPYPAERIEQAIEEAAARARKRAAEIVEKGKAVAEEIKAKEQELATLQASAEDDRFTEDEETLKSELNAIKSRINEHNDALTGLPSIDALAAEDAAVLAAQQELSAAREALDLAKSKAPDLSAYQAAIVEAKEALGQANAKKMSLELNESVKRRIAALEEEHRDLADKVAELEGAEYRIDWYKTRQCKLLEERIGERFKLVRWKLFDTQVNGAIVDCCVATVDGVPYPDMNTAAKINAGLDIVSALQKEHGFNAPVWVDNRESVLSPIDIDTQTIYMTVSDTDRLVVK